MLPLCVRNRQAILPNLSFLFLLQELWTWVANSPQSAKSP